MHSTSFAFWAALLGLVQRLVAQDLMGDSDPDWAVSPGGLLEKLRQEQAGVKALSDQVMQMKASLSNSEVIFSSAAHKVAAHQDDLWNLSVVAHSNRDHLHKVSKIVSGDTAEFQSMGDELGLLWQRQHGNSKFAEKIAETAKQFNSLGDVKNKAGGCLDAVERTKQGSHLQMWECMKGRESQEWSLDIHTGRFKNRHGICMAAPTPGTIGSALLMWDCVAGGAAQTWAYDETAFAIKTSGGLCLTAAASTVKGSALQLAACTGGAGQQWDMAAGTTGLRKRLDDLNTELWNLQSPTSPESMDAQEEQIKGLETGIGGFMQKLSKEAMSVLGGRLRHRANNLRTAIDQLGDAASAGSDSDQLLAPERDEGLQPLGSDLGLAAAAAA